jgi:hypothetical protein
VPRAFWGEVSARSAPNLGVLGLQSNGAHSRAWPWLGVTNAVRGEPFGQAQDRLVEPPTPRPSAKLRTGLSNHRPRALRQAQANPFGRLAACLAIDVG